MKKGVKRQKYFIIKIQRNRVVRLVNAKYIWLLLLRMGLAGQGTTINLKMQNVCPAQGTVAHVPVRHDKRCLVRGRIHLSHEDVTCCCSCCCLDKRQLTYSWLTAISLDHCQSTATGNVVSAHTSDWQLLTRFLFANFSSRYTPIHFEVEIRFALTRDERRELNSEVRKREESTTTAGFTFI